MLALDTNVLAHAEGVDDHYRQARAIKVIASLPAEIVMVLVQVLGELFRVLTIKMGRSPAEARGAILSWRDTMETRATSATALLAAMDLVADHHFSFWEALILAVVAESGCRLLLSGGVLEGFTWRGVTVVNPFAESIHPLLAAQMTNNESRP